MVLHEILDDIVAQKPGARDKLQEYIARIADPQTDADIQTSTAFGSSLCSDPLFLANFLLTYGPYMSRETALTVVHWLDYARPDEDYAEQGGALHLAPTHSQLPAHNRRIVPAPDSQCRTLTDASLGYIVKSMLKTYGANAFSMPILELLGLASTLVTSDAFRYYVFSAFEWTKLLFVQYGPLQPGNAFVRGWLLPNAVAMACARYAVRHNMPGILFDLLANPHTKPLSHPDGMTTLSLVDLRSILDTIRGCIACTNSEWTFLINYLRFILRVGGIDTNGLLLRT